MSDEPKKWGEMTDAEKGALLLAHHEGKVIESWSGIGSPVKGIGEWGHCDEDDLWISLDFYRVKPREPREVWVAYDAAPNTDGPVTVVDTENRALPDRFTWFKFREVIQ